ncbi:hypothetical protein CQW23_33084 [Capsicum baccatum]|uniref:Rab3-GAP regulatory subunit N-terminal domain-containing protein n=1 Tax=Capsicum baccatum TaxID=33114 RepID=A0A2G2V2U8_CAPBA|nr:hypothetical protein CQW23_33084 [Capsicum baccatum]
MATMIGNPLHHLLTVVPMAIDAVAHPQVVVVDMVVQEAVEDIAVYMVVIAMDDQLRYLLMEDTQALAAINTTAHPAVLGVDTVVVVDTVPINIVDTVVLAAAVVDMVIWEAPMVDTVVQATPVVDTVVLIVSPEKILRLRVRDTKRTLTQDASSEEVCVIMSGVIARFDGSDIQNILQRWFRERYSQFWDEKESENSRQTFGRLPYQLWNISKYGSCVDAAITCLMPPPPPLLFGFRTI